MILSGRTIKELLDSGALVISPIGEGQIQPASVDLRVSAEMLILKAGEIDFGKEQEYVKVAGEYIVIPPKTHALLRTLERVELPHDIAAMTKLRSSLSRVGIVFNNAGWVDPGFRGTLTISVFNSNDFPVRIKPGTRFSQLVLMRLDRESDGYAGKYSEQHEVTGKIG